jgi:hypothetical protein
MKTNHERNYDKRFLFGANYFDPKVIDSLHLNFSRHGYVRLAGLIEQTTFDLLKSEIERVSAWAKAMDFNMPSYETLRLMTTLGGKIITKESPLLADFYENPELRRILSGITGGSLYNNNDENEWCVATYLNGERQTHGFHLDDPPIALIVIIKTPPPEFGGYLEMITDWREIARIYDRDPERDVLPLVEEMRKLNLIQTKMHVTGDAYLLRADQCLHAVAPLRGKNVSRSILNMAFELEPNVVRQSRTAAALFDTKQDE